MNRDDPVDTMTASVLPAAGLTAVSALTALLGG
jgi:hypothetical protein